ncbi:YHS domain-containing (seleno)protein [Fulvivirga sp.]|uniref:YHS domain-containing (seleno)protein n=1 Tax=Fulvivirga sp. TaxID=1931237 RepID=UPI0032EC9442
MKNLILIIGLIVAGYISATAQIPPVDENGLAIGGYDVVSYFDGKAQKGNAKFTVKQNGATYRFASAAHRDAFKKEPAKYLPQFDGYCAWGVAAKDTKFPINPETFDIIDGKLYLFFNGPFDGQNFNTVLLWTEETTKLKAQAHSKWPSVKNK